MTIRTNAEIKEMYASGLKIQAIKALREKFPFLGLKEAKDTVDGVLNYPPEARPPVPGDGPSWRDLKDELPPPPPPAPKRPHVTNQWGQDIEVDDIVAYVSKTGSTTERKIGVVTALTEINVNYPQRKLPAARVEWKWNGSFCENGKPPTRIKAARAQSIRVMNLLKLQPSSMSNDMLEAFC